MPVDQYEEADELRKRKRVMLSLPFGPDEKSAFKQVVRELSESGSRTFEGRASAIENWARETLIKAELPEEGNCSSRTKYPRREWFANRVMVDLFFIRGLIEQGRTAEVADFSLHLGRVIQEA